MAALSEDREERKNAPMARALLDYFPAALAAVAECSKKANDFHNPGEEIHWARDKSNDHADCIIRHLVDRGSVDSDGIRHSVKVAWRALALLQEELEAEGAEVSRASRLGTPSPVGGNGWVRWDVHGALQPPKGGCEVMLRDGNNPTVTCDSWSWGPLPECPGVEIVAYKVVDGQG